MFQNKKLYYLDDRPITEAERKGVEAFKEGGKEAEMAVRAQLAEEAHRKNCPSTKAMSETIETGKKERKALFKKMLADAKGEKQALVDQRSELKSKMKDLPVESADRSRLHQKVMAIDEEFRQDYLEKVKESGEELPSCMRPKTMTTEQYLADNTRRQ